MAQKKFAPNFCAVDVSELILKGDNALNNNKPEEAVVAYKEASQKLFCKSRNFLSYLQGTQNVV